MLHAYVNSQLGRRRWFLHDRGNAPLVQSQSETSFLQQRFLVLAHNEYGQTKDDLPAKARRHL